MSLTFKFFLLVSEILVSLLFFSQKRAALLLEVNRTRGRTEENSWRKQELLFDSLSSSSLVSLLMTVWRAAFPNLLKIQNDRLDFDACAGRKQDDEDDVLVGFNVLCTSLCCTFSSLSLFLCLNCITCVSMTDQSKSLPSQ